MATQLPITPPPSPPRRRHQKKQHDDPFADLNTPLPSPDLPSDNAKEENDESLITRIILTPLLFTSFLISLFLVNLSDRLRRSRAHNTRPKSRYTDILYYIYPSSWLESLDPEPYQDPSTSTWNRDASPSSLAHVEPHSVLNPGNRHDPDSREGTGESSKDGMRKRKRSEKKGWFLRKKIRKVAKLELDDAFAMRGRIIAGMLVLAGVFLIGVIMGVRWTVKWVW